MHARALCSGLANCWSMRWLDMCKTYHVWMSHLVARNALTLSVKPACGCNVLLGCYNVIASGNLCMNFCNGFACSNETALWILCQGQTHCKSALYTMLRYGNRADVALTTCQAEPTAWVTLALLYKSQKCSSAVVQFIQSSRLHEFAWLKHCRLSTATVANHLCCSATRYLFISWLILAAPFESPTWLSTTLITSPDFSSSVLGWSSARCFEQDIPQPVQRW